MNLGLCFIIISNFAASTLSEQQVQTSVTLEKRLSPNRSRNPFLDRAEDESLQSNEDSLTTIGILEGIPDDESVDRNGRPSPPLSVGDSLPDSTGRNSRNQQSLALGDSPGIPWYLWQVDKNTDELRNARDSLDGRPLSSSNPRLPDFGDLSGTEVLIPIRDPQSTNTVTAAKTRVTTHQEGMNRRPLRESHYRLPELPEFPIREPPRLQTTSTPIAVRMQATGRPTT